MTKLLDPAAILQALNAQLFPGTAIKNVFDNAEQAPAHQEYANESIRSAEAHGVLEAIAEILNEEATPEMIAAGVWRTF